MKKSLLALAALTAFAGAASAQSSVTLFGVADLSLRSVDNDQSGSRKVMATDGNASSRLGFRGVEDLGGGLRAGFWLEAGLSMDNGSVGGGNGGATANAPATTCAAAAGCSAASGAFFNRRSTASLIGGFGEVRLGRDYVPTFWNHTVFDVFGTNGVGSATNIITTAPGVAPFGSAQTLVRANNSIGYFLPAMGGLYGQVMVAAGENQNPGNKYMGGRIGYGAGPLNAAVAYGRTENAAALDDMKAFNFGASYNFGFLTAYGQYNKYDQGDLDLKNFSVGVGVPMGAGTFKASYGKTDRTTATAEPSSTQFALGYVYDMSKRTALYAHYARISNDAGATFTTGTGGPANAGTADWTSTGYEFGIRHSF